MANAIYTLKALQTDRVIFDDAGTIINIRVRPGETIEVDLSDPDQDAAFDESKYDVAGASYRHKLKPSEL